MKVRELIARLLECDQEAEVGVVEEMTAAIVMVERVDDAYEAVPAVQKDDEQFSRLVFREAGSTYFPLRYRPSGPARPAVVIE